MMGRFSRLFEQTVTPVAPALHPVLPEKVNHFKAVALVTPVTQRNSHSCTKKENSINSKEIKRHKVTENSSRELYITGVTGVTGVTELKNNGNFGNTVFFEGVTGVTVGKVDQTVPSIVVAIRAGDPVKIAEVVASDPDLLERAAIREVDGGMSRADAEIAVLHDVAEERGYAI